MPKIKDLGIKVIPETMRPPEAGGGAGCACTNFTNCIGCTQDVTVAQQVCPGWTNCRPTHGAGCSNPFTVGTLNCRQVLITPGCGPSIACGPISLVCAGSIGPTIVQHTGIATEQIAALKDALRRQIAALEEHEKSIGPRTVAEIDMREKAIKDELADLKARRKELK